MVNIELSSPKEQAVRESAYTSIDVTEVECHSTSSLPSPFLALDG